MKKKERNNLTSYQVMIASPFVLSLSAKPARELRTSPSARLTFCFNPKSACVALFALLAARIPETLGSSRGGWDVLSDERRLASFAARLGAGWARSLPKTGIEEGVVRP